MPPHISLLDPDAAADHRSRLLAVARSLCGSTHLAEDLTQETYARVLSRPRRLGDGADFPYLDRNPEAAVIASEVYTAVDRLPEEFRRVVQAVDVLGLSYGQTARTLRIPPGTVMSRLSRARSRLACALA